MSKPPAETSRISVNAVVRVLLGIVVLFSYWTYTHLALTRPSLGDYDGAAAYIREHFQPGDLIDVSPFWALRAREYLGDLTFAGLHHLEREDLTGYRRIWLFSLFGAEGDRNTREALGRAGSLVEDRRFGRIEVRLYATRAYEPVRYDLFDRIEKARVSIQVGALAEPCSVWEGNRWRCAAAGWEAIGQETLEISDEPRTVITLHPMRGRILSVEFDDLILGRAITVGAGLPGEAPLQAAAPVKLTVRVDDLSVMERSYEPGGFFRNHLDTSRFAGGRHRVTFTLMTEDQRPRAFGFAAEVRD